MFVTLRGPKLTLNPVSISKKIINTKHAMKTITLLEQLERTEENSLKGHVVLPVLDCMMCLFPISSAVNADGRTCRGLCACKPLY